MRKSASVPAKLLPPGPSETVPGERAKKRLDTSHLIVGYAMSRLDKRYLEAFRSKTWNAAFAEAGRLLDAQPKSLKGLRDEFDPIHSNPRRGWTNRKMLPSRQRVALELETVSDAALIELVRHLLIRDEAATAEALDALAPETTAPEAVANRLLTGRLAEEFVIERCEEVLGYPSSAVVDMRDSLLGFDLKLDLHPEVVVEVKGLRASRGDLLFTDREWQEAQRRRQGYWLAIVGELYTSPRHEVIRDPAGSRRLAARCVFEHSVRASWRYQFSLET
jgi:hypothetical protein